MVMVRHNLGEAIFYYRNAEGRVVSVEARWTNVVPPDPVVAVSAGRSPFRLEDLLEIARLVAALQQEVPHGR